MAGDAGLRCLLTELRSVLPYNGGLGIMLQAKQEGINEIRPGYEAGDKLLPGDRSKMSKLDLRAREAVNEDLKLLDKRAPKGKELLIWYKKAVQAKVVQLRSLMVTHDAVAKLKVDEKEVRKRVKQKLKEVKENANEDWIQAIRDVTAYMKSNKDKLQSRDEADYKEYERERDVLIDRQNALDKIREDTDLEFRVYKDKNQDLESLLEIELETLVDKANIQGRDARKELTRMNQCINSGDVRTAMSVSERDYTGANRAFETLTTRYRFHRSVYEAYVALQVGPEYERDGIADLTKVSNTVRESARRVLAAKNEWELYEKGHPADGRSQVSEDLLQEGFRKARALRVDLVVIEKKYEELRTLWLGIVYDRLKIKDKIPAYQYRDIKIGKKEGADSEPVVTAKPTYEGAWNEQDEDEQMVFEKFATAENMKRR
jgi:hypothetical protein